MVFAGESTGRSSYNVVLEEEETTKRGATGTGGGGVVPLPVLDLARSRSTTCRSF